ncbi:AAA family ATPase [Cohnella sp. 56]|uniref:AAA family ATPase n=1 Tax=Cohnella sp. 56 TaxID=3113722 RepID=UPI0030E94048
MYIEELHIEGFGPLSGVRLGFEAPVTIVWGPNEAGKSTLLRFIRSMLYGFATRAQLPERGEPVGGGRHGGRLVLREDGQMRVLERYGDIPVRRGGPVAVLREADGSERALAQADIERLLLGGVSEQLFRQLYAVGLDELHELRALQGDEIGNFLYHAGMAGGAALSSAGKQLRTEMDRLYKPKGTVQEIGMLLARIRELESRLRQGRQELGAYMEALGQLEALSARAEALEQALPALRVRAAEAKGALDSREWWLRATALAAEETAIEAELSAAGQQAELLPPEAGAEWRNLGSRRDEARAAARRAAAERAALEAERAALRWDAPLVAMLGRLEALDLRGDAIQARRGEAEGLAADMRMAEEAASSALQRLGPGWREEDTAAVAAVSEREEARRIGERLAEAERQRELLAVEAQRLRRQLAAFDLEAERRSESDETPAAVSRRFAPRTREALMRAWHRLDDALQAAESAWAASAAESAYGAADMERGPAVPVGEPGASAIEGRTSAAGGRSRARRTQPLDRAATGRRLYAYSLPAAVLGAAAGLWAALSSAAVEGRAAYGLLAAVLAAAAAALWLLARRQAARAPTAVPAAGAAAIRQRWQAALQAEAAARRLAETALRELIGQPDAKAAVAPADRPHEGRIGGAGDAVPWDALGEWRIALRDEVYGQLDRLTEAEAARDRRADLAARRDALARELQSAESELADAESAVRRTREEWSAWLSARGLPGHLQPSALPELGQLAEQALQQLRQRARLAARAAELEAERADFEIEAAELLAAYPPPAHAGRDRALALKLLYREARQQAETAAAARLLDARLLQAAAAETAALAALQAADDAAAAALRGAGAASEEAYALRVQADERRRELRRERREAELRLSAGRGEAELQALVGLLETHDEAALALHAAQAGEVLDDGEAERTTLLDARGRLAEKLERLRSEAETEEKALELEELQTELERLAERYALLAVTAELIRRTRVTFEEERQPAVLRQASAYFAELTAGRYSRIAVPGDAPDLHAETADRRTIGSAFLSRGTQEQLYLSLRLALAEAASREQALPLLLDDLFVHYDEARLGRCAGILSELSASRQIILFTCHRHVAETLAAGMPASKLLKLPELAAGGRSLDEGSASDAAS